MFNYVISQEALTYVWIKNVSVYMCWCIVENIIYFLIHTNVLIHRNVTQMCYFYESVWLWNIILMCVYLCKCIEQDLTVPCWCGFPHALKASILTLASGELTKQMVLDTFCQQGWCTVLQMPPGRQAHHRAILPWGHSRSSGYSPTVASSAAPYFMFRGVALIFQKFQMCSGDWAWTAAKNQREIITLVVIR